MWNFHQASPKDYLFAKQLIYSLQSSGIRTFPDFHTCWHFDDKLGQKYLLEALGAPLIPSYVFYDKKDAIRWINETKFPVVFKLRGGASSSNVRLVRGERQAINLINRAFGSGFRRHNPTSGIRDIWRNIKKGKAGYTDFFHGLARFFIRTRFEKVAGNERGYVYFQEFIKGCTFDIRVKVIDGKCWAFRRFNRENDFRASGSNSLLFSKDGIPLDVIRIALDISRRMHLQSVAFDFLISEENEPLITELSYSFGYDKGENYGYWDSDLNWHDESFNPFAWMVNSLTKEINSQR
jgi:glutathione synthase/RimK-type ligase-like ATP-grasp enzyme